MEVGASDVYRRRLAAQLLTGPPAKSVGAVVERLLAVQAQDPRGARLAVRSRSTGLHVSDVDRALDGGELVVTWFNRGTLHLVRREDYWWLHALTTPPLFKGNARRLQQEGVSAEAAERGVAVIEQALAADGPLTRPELRDRIAAAGVTTDGQALVHLFLLASLRGLIVRGPMRGKEQAYVLVRDWLGEPHVFDRDMALGELARRYLRGHGPASDHDLAKWTGLPLRDARAAFTEVASELGSRDDGLAELKTHRRRTAELPPPRLMGTFEPLLLGWTSRDDVLPEGRAKDFVTDNGIFRAFAMVDGRAVGTWGLAGKRVTITPFEPLPTEVDDGLAQEADRVVAFLN